MQSQHMKGTPQHLATILSFSIKFLSSKYYLCNGLQNYSTTFITLILDREANSVLPTAGIPEVHKYGSFSINSTTMSIGIKPRLASKIHTNSNRTTLLLRKRNCTMQRYTVI